MRCVIIAVVVGRFWAFALLMPGWCAAMPAAETPVNPPPPGLLTNLLQLRTAARQTPSVVHPFRIVADVVAADSADGVLALRDASGVEFIRVDFGSRAVEPGATVCLEGTGCAVRLNSFGLEIVPGLVVNNDGTHSLASASGATFLPAGKHPLTVEWFNRFGTFGLNVDYEGPNQPRQPMPGSMLSRADVDPATGRTNFSAGLDYRCCEGLWEFLPDFEKCPPAKTGVATNFDLDVRTRDAAVGLEFRGFITIPTDGVYTFHLASDDGSRLLVGDPSVDVRVLRQQPAPAAAVRVPSGAFAGNPRPWMTLEGTVAYSSIWNAGGELQLRVGNDDLRVEVFAGDDFAPALPAHGRVRVSGVYEDVLTEAGARVPGRLRVLNWKAVRPAGGLETAPAKAIGDGAMTPPPAGGVPAAPVAAPLSTAAEIKALSSDLAGRQLPVSMRGVVTVYASKVDGAVVQDSTRGVFVDLHEMGEAEPLQRNELCQIEGVTGPGLFAPVVVARRISHLGPGQLPQPLHASWDQLLNGSLDTEYAEIDGVVTALRDHQVVLLMQGGKMALDLRDLRPESLLGYEGAVVRIRGCPLANFDLETHRLEPGPLVVRGAAIEVLQPAPRDLFEAPHKRIGELMLYDPKAAPFRLLKVNGQIIGGRPGEYFLTDGTNGLRVIMKNSAAFAVGELVDTVGFLELGGPAAELREAVMRRTGSAPLRPPIKVASDRLLQAGCADMRVRVAATLMNQWREGSDCLLELQSGFLAFKARINCDGREVSLPPPGSRLELTGVYVPQGNRAGDGTVSGFELLLPSPAGIRVLASPPWTLKRLLVLGGILAMLLCVVLIWNKQLQQQVQERTRKLELEIRGRQWAELQQAAEAERARIARDLHDDLGTGLTEVSLLASVGLGQFEDGEKIRQRFDTIAEKARALVSGLDVIVWAIDPQRNSLQSFADYLGGYAKELLSSSAIVCRLRIRMECGGVALTEAARHSLFLAVKEALNNVIRHASASAVEIQISQLNHHLHIAITDNGRGFDGHLIQRGRGLTNLEERLQAMRGECRIESQPGGGTTVKFKVALTPATQVDAPA